MGSQFHSFLSPGNAFGALIGGECEGTWLCFCFFTIAGRPKKESPYGHFGRGGDDLGELGAARPAGRTPPPSGASPKACDGGDASKMYLHKKITKRSDLALGQASLTKTMISFQEVMWTTLETFQNEAESSISPRRVSLYVEASHFRSLSAIFGGNAFRPVQTTPGPVQTAPGPDRSIPPAVWTGQTGPDHPRTSRPVQPGSKAVAKYGRYCSNT